MLQFFFAVALPSINLFGMCGIAGYVDWQTRPCERVLRAMEKAVFHRGPDEGRVWSDEHCGFAHRRLRVIDLSPAAAQPMASEDEQLRVIFNGEVYNFPYLREQLLELGHTFTSHSDTEVLLHGYESWGSALFERLRGMFAFALWNAKSQDLIFARDRLGKKPFFFAINSAQFIFGSELTVFRCLPTFSLSISPEAFCQYVEFGYVQSPLTILNQVQQLPAGHFGVWNRNGLTIQPFWSFPRPPSLSSKISAAAASLETPFRDAVACRLIADVPLGCFLSGGIDSSLVAAYAQELITGRLQTFTVGFEDSSRNEAGYATEIARHLGTEHHELQVNSQSVLTEFESILSTASEPIGDDSFIPTFLISRETRKAVTVALSGDGGDELFCGYDKYRQFVTASQIRKLTPGVARSAALSLLAGHLPDRPAKVLALLATSNEEGLARWLSTLFKQSELPALIDPKLLRANSIDHFSKIWRSWSGVSSLERFMHTDMQTYLPGDILTKVDRASMAHGLEVRNPFLDQEFIRSAFAVNCRAHPGKSILKEMLAQWVPRQLFERPKHGFGLPIDEWYRGPLRQLLEHYTSPARVTRRGLLNSGAVQQFVHSHTSGRRNFGRKLHVLVAFEVWADKFFDPNETLT